MAETTGLIEQYAQYLEHKASGVVLRLAVLGALVFLAAGSLDQLGVAAISFLPPLGLAFAELPWLAVIPTAAAMIAWGTARVSVIAALHEFY